MLPTRLRQQPSAKPRTPRVIEIFPRQRTAPIKGDNLTVACEQDLVRDHDLIKRCHTQGILNPDKRANDEWEASIYVYDGAPEGDRDCNGKTGEV
jgi:hypothetical protein